MDGMGGKRELSEKAMGGEDKDWRLGKDWLLAAAGSESLAEELRTGRCRCGKLLREESEGCRWHDGAKEQVQAIIRGVVRWSGREQNGGYGPTGEDLELIGGFLPRDFLFAYEVLVHRSVVVSGGSLRGGQGYDETRIAGVGRSRGGMGATKSGTREERLVAGPRKKSGGSGKPVIRDEAALAYRRRLERRLRKLARDALVWLEEGASARPVSRCSGRRCGLFAEDSWRFCPTCGSAVGSYVPGSPGTPDTVR